MTRTIGLGLICVLLNGLVGCAQQKITVNFDKGYDFAALKTYTWDPIKEAGTQNRELEGKTMAEILTESVDRALEAKGFSKTAANPTFRVHAYTQIQYKRVDAKESDPGAIAESRVDAAYDPVPPSPGDTGVMPEQYAEGTIIIDMIDPATGKPIWRGVEVGTLKQKIDPEKRIERIDAAVTKLLKDFPPGK